MFRMQDKEGLTIIPGTWWSTPW